MRRSGRRLRGALAASLLFHLALFLVPAAWWATVVASGGGGAAGREGAVPGVFTVSLAPPEAAEPRAAEPRGAPPLPEPVPPVPAAAVRPAVPSPAAEAAVSSPAAEAAVSPEGASERGEGATGAGAAAATGSTGDRTGTPGPAEPRPGFRPPQLLVGALPLAPDESSRLRVPGEIPVRLRVGTDGRVVEVVPGVEGLPAPVLDAVHRSAAAMRFRPARMGGNRWRPGSKCASSSGGDVPGFLTACPRLL